MTLVLGSETPTRIANEFLVQVEAPGRPRRLPPASAFRTILWTDLVGHTEMMSRLGDEPAAPSSASTKPSPATSSSHTAAPKSRQWATASWLRSVPSPKPSNALSPSSAPSPSATVSRSSVRVGLNAGEPIEEDGDLFGATVILASRIAAKAEGGEILVADTVRGLCSGKGFLFADRGEFVAKGFEEPVRLYEVRWRSA